MTFPAPTHPRTTLAQDWFRSAETMARKYSEALDTDKELAEQYWQAYSLLFDAAFQRTATPYNSQYCLNVATHERRLAVDPPLGITSQQLIANAEYHERLAAQFAEEEACRP